MNRRVSPWAALVGPLLAVVAVLAVLAAPQDASAVSAQATPQAQNRAAIIVDTGGGSRAVCVRFDEAAISGVAALQRAGLGAVVRSFSGQGAAVCGINGVGCPADDSCLSCKAPNYWAYHRASPGSGGFAFSSAGAGSTQVTDGSVEGWKWGTGGAPGFQSVDQVCGASAPTPPPTAAPQPSPTPGNPSSPSGPSGGEVASPAVPVPDFRTTTTAVGPTTTAGNATTTSTTEADTSTAPGPGDEAELTGDLAAAQRSADDGGGSPVLAVLFGLLVVALGGSAFVIHRRRSI